MPQEKGVSYLESTSLLYLNEMNSVLSRVVPIYPPNRSGPAAEQDEDIKALGPKIRQILI